MKITLLFPPQCFPIFPYLALPALTAFLRSKGYNVIQRDVDAEIHDIFFSKKEIERAHRAICREFERLDAMKTRRGLSHDEKAKYEHLAILCVVGIYLYEEIEDAKRALKSEAFYDINHFLKSYRIFAAALKLISGPYYPTTLYTSPDKSKLAYSPESSEEVLKAVEDKETNPYIDFFTRHTIPSLLEEKPEIVGISINLREQLIPGLTLCRMIKASNPDIHVVVGGTHITSISDILLRDVKLFSLFDSAVLHEGEHALLGLVKRLSERKSLEGIPNLIYREGTAVKISKIHHRENINSLPPPDFDGLPLNLYFSPDLVLPLQSSRGCYWGCCAFCDIGHDFMSHYRCRETTRLIEDIKKLSHKYHPSFFYFVDDAMAPRPMRNLSHKLRDLALNINWVTNARFEKEFASADFCGDLYRSGCRALFFGLESASKRVLDIMNKGTDIRTIKNILETTCKTGICNYISMFYGFPTETAEEALQTRQFIFENESNIHFITVSGGFNLLKHSPAFNNPEGFHITKIVKSEKQDLRRDYDYEVSEGMDHEEAVKMCNDLREDFPPKWKIGTFYLNVIGRLLYTMKYSVSDLSTLKGMAEALSEPYHNEAL